MKIAAGIDKRQRARELKQAMQGKRAKVKATLKELILLLECKQAGDFIPMQDTKLYKQHGSEYCNYLELIV
jgi:hypothetical protein